MFMENIVDFPVKIHDGSRKLPENIMTGESGRASYHLMSGEGKAILGQKLLFLSRPPTLLSKSFMFLYPLAEQADKEISKSLKARKRGSERRLENFNRFSGFFPGCMVLTGVKVDFAIFSIFQA